MTPQFTTNCYVRVDDKNKQKEICDKLEPIGYKIKVDYTEDINPIVVASKLGILYDASRFEGVPDYIDCGTNIDLFLALAGMQEDTDLNQFFINKSKFSKRMIKCRKDKLTGSRFYNTYYKATAQEIIEHFNKK